MKALSLSFSLLLWGLGLLNVTAIPNIIPSLEGAEFTGTILQVRGTRAGHVPMVILRLGSYEGLDAEVAVRLYKALRHEARFRVFHPRKRFVEIAVPKEMMTGLERGDRVRVSGYLLSGQSGDRPLRVSFKGIENIAR